MHSYRTESGYEMYKFYKQQRQNLIMTSIIWTLQQTFPILAALQHNTFNDG